MRTVIHDYDEVLSHPLRLGSRTTLRGARIRLADDYSGGWQEVGRDQRGNYGVVRVEKGAKDVTIEGAVIDGPSPDWWLGKRHPQPAGSQPLPWVWPTRGIAVNDATGVTISHTRVSGMIAQGVYACDVSDFLLQDCWIDRCNGGVFFDWPRTSGNKRVFVDGLTSSDMLCLDNLSGEGPSLYYPPHRVGGNWLAGTGLENSTVRRVTCMGEGKGIKITEAHGLVMDQIRTPQLWLGGYAQTVGDRWRGPSEVRGLSLTRSILGEGTLGFGEGRTSDQGALHCYGPTVDELEVSDTIIHAPRPGTYWAPWWGDRTFPNFRFPCVASSTGFKIHLAANVLLLDLDADAPEPPWVDGDAQALVRVDESVQRRRIPPTWFAG